MKNVWLNLIMYHEHLFGFHVIFETEESSTVVVATTCHCFSNPWVRFHITSKSTNKFHKMSKIRLYLTSKYGKLLDLHCVNQEECFSVWKFFNFFQCLAESFLNAF